MVAAQAEITEIFKNNDFGGAIVTVNETELVTGEELLCMYEHHAEVVDVDKRMMDYSDMCVSDVVFILEKVRKYDKRKN